MVSFIGVRHCDFRTLAFDYLCLSFSHAVCSRPCVSFHIRIGLSYCVLAGCQVLQFPASVYKFTVSLTVLVSVRACHGKDDRRFLLFAQGQSAHALAHHKVSHLTAVRIRDLHSCGLTLSHGCLSVCHAVAYVQAVVAVKICPAFRYLVLTGLQVLQQVFSTCERTVAYGLAVAFRACHGKGDRCLLFSAQVPVRLSSCKYFLKFKASHGFIICNNNCTSIGIFICCPSQHIA